MVKHLKNEKKKGPNKIFLFILVFVLVFGSSFGAKLVSYFSYQKSSVEADSNTNEMGYTEFLQKLEENKVETATFSNSAATFVFSLKDDETSYITDNPGTEEFKETLLLNGVTVTDITYSNRDTYNSSPYLLLSDIFSSLFSAFLTTSLLFILVYMLSSSTMFLKSQGNEKAKEVSFSSIIGLDEIKSELLFIVSLMKNQPTDSTVRIPKGILLEGPPGNGKTMLAQAIATEAGVNFISINASELTDKFLGETGKSVRKIFEKAAENAPCVLFIDEIDAIGSKRTEGADDAVDKELNSVINTLLTKLDGVSVTTGVTVIAATNMASSLDPALIRPGRFDKRFYIPNPNATARKDLFATYLSDAEKQGYNYDKLAAMTHGCSCSEIENIVNESKLIALKENVQKVDETHLVKAIRQFQMKGLSREETVLTDRDRKTVAIHEAGHAIVGHYFSNQEIDEISICSTTSGAGGYTQTVPTDCDNLAYSEEVFGKIVMLMAGKAAEYIASGSNEKISFGSNNDIDEATKLATIFVKFKSGMNYAQFGEAAIPELMQETKKILDEAYEQAVSTAQEFKDKMLLVAKELEEAKNLSGERFLEIIGANC